MSSRDSCVQVKVDDGPNNTGKPGLKDSIGEWFDKSNNLLLITWKHLLAYIWLSYFLNIIFFWVLDDAGRIYYSKVAFCFGRLYTILPVQFLLGSLLFLVLGRYFQAIQIMLPGTNKLMRYYSTSLVMTKENDPRWPEKRVKLIKKWNDWVLLAWLLTIRSISTPLRNYYPTLEKIKAENLMTNLEYRCLIEQQQEKNLNNSELSLVVFEWLTSANERSGYDYKVPIDVKSNFDAIQALKKSGSSLLKFANKNTPKLMILAATLSVYIFALASIMGHNIAEFEKDPFTSFSTAAIIGAFFYPLVYCVPFFFYCVWVCYLRSTLDPFGWDDDDANVLEIFKGHVENAKRFCNNPAVEFSHILDQPYI